MDLRGVVPAFPFIKNVVVVPKFPTGYVLPSSHRPCGRPEMHIGDSLPMGWVRVICPKLTGGGLIRSQGGWSQVLAMRRKDHKEESDERILGGGDFVHAILKRSRRKKLRQLKLRRGGRNIADIIRKQCEKRKVSPEELKERG